MSRYISRYEKKQASRYKQEYRKPDKKLNKKKVFAVVVIIAVIILGIIKLNKKQPEIIEKSLENTVKVEAKYFSCLNDNKWGIIDETGNQIIPCEYDEMIQMPDSSKDIFICYYDVDYNSNQYKTKVLNKEDKEILTGYEQVEGIMNTAGGESMWYESNVLKFKKDEKIGLIDFSGKVVLQANYDDIKALDSVRNRLIITKENKRGLVDTAGNIIVDTNYDDIIGELTSSKTGYITVLESEGNKLYGYISSNGDKRIDPQYNEISIISDIKDPNKILLVVKKEDKYGIVDEQNNQILPIEFEEIDGLFTNNMFVCKKDSKWGIVNSNNEVIIDYNYLSCVINSKCIIVRSSKNEQMYDFEGKAISENTYDKIYGPNDEFMIVEKSNKYGVYSLADSKEIISPSYKRIEYISNGLFSVQKSSSKYAIINKENEELTEYKYTNISGLGTTSLIECSDSNNSFLLNLNMDEIASLDKYSINLKDNYITATKDEKIKYYDLNGVEITAKDVYTNNKLFVDIKDEKYGYVDYQGNVVLDNIYEDATEFNSKGFAAVKQNGKWAVVNSAGNIITDFIYEFKNNEEISFIGSWYLKTNEILQYYTK